MIARRDVLVNNHKILTAWVKHPGNTYPEERVSCVQLRVEPDPVLCAVSSARMSVLRYEWVRSGSRHVVSVLRYELAQIEWKRVVWVLAFLPSQANEDLLVYANGQILSAVQWQEEAGAASPNFQTKGRM